MKSTRQLQAAIAEARSSLASCRWAVRGNVERRRSLRFALLAHKARLQMRGRRALG